MLPTEQRNPKTTHIDKASTPEILQMIHAENQRSVDAVGEALPMIEAAVNAVTAALRDGGRLIYVGAGTSGRLAAVDASECPPTFGVDYELVSAVMAGGTNAFFRAAENQEDAGAAGVQAMHDKHLQSCDVVMGISASGNADFILEALKYAKSVGCTVLSLSSNPDAKIGKVADFPIFTDTGAEVITGSTRMKAGNAQKMVLNMISTAAMIQTGKVYENMMINLRPTNKKLRERMITIVCDITGVDRTEAEILLQDSGFSIPAAVERYNGQT